MTRLLISILLLASCAPRRYERLTRTERRADASLGGKVRSIAPGYASLQAPYVERFTPDTLLESAELSDGQSPRACFPSSGFAIDRQAYSNYQGEMRQGESSLYLCTDNGDAIQKSRMPGTFQFASGRKMNATRVTRSFLGTVRCKVADTGEVIAPVLNARVVEVQIWSRALTAPQLNSDDCFEIFKHREVRDGQGQLLEMVHEEVTQTQRQ